MSLELGWIDLTQLSEEERQGLLRDAEGNADYLYETARMAIRAKQEDIVQNVMDRLTNL